MSGFYEKPFLKFERCLLTYLKLCALGLAFIFKGHAEMA